MVPNEPAKPASGSLKTQKNGLPEGVKILGTPPEKLESTSAPEPDLAATPEPAVERTTPTTLDIKHPNKPLRVASIVQSRQRISTSESSTDASAPEPAHDAKLQPTTTATKTKKRKPGRPKAGRLDVPRSAAIINHAAPAPAAAAPSHEPAPPTPAPVPKPATPEPVVVAAPLVPASKVVTDIHRPAKKAKTQPPAHHVHRVGVAPLHWGSVISITLHTAFARRHLGLAAAGTVVLGAIATTGAWLFLTGQLQTVASNITHAVTPGLVVELVCLAVLYYLGRVIGQSAIIYGVSRNTDGRPVGLGMQLGVAINAIGRRLELDIISGLIGALLLCGIGLLVTTGGTSWGIDSRLQLVVLFIAFMGLLYLQCANSLTHGLAAVAIMLTKQPAHQALRLGWRLFSHRLELIGVRFVAVALEALIALPLAAAAAGLITIAPHGLWPATVLSIGLIAWLCGAVLGAGSATWWAHVYRKIIMLDQASNAVELLSARQPVEASRLKLALVAAVGSSALAVAVFVPWL